MTSTLQHPGVLLFDVNETLLDTGPLKKKIGDLLQDATGGNLWFTTMLHYSLVMTVSDRYTDLPEIGAATLQMLARNSDVSLAAEEAKAVLAEMRSLAPHPDVMPALERLRHSGMRLATLTNSSQAGVKTQLAHAGLDRFFERQLSVESLRIFKPHRAVYEWAAREMGARPDECMLVAAHGWDVAGAHWAGLRTAFLARERQQKFPLVEPPDLDVADLSALADRFGLP